ncbi:MAG TPA: glucose-6-phosphate dehydrogenase [Polyangiaceae bacterium]|nr:glucose-6-phosphate dehydrogenase [Polyangiaceae bacterium]
MNEKKAEPGTFVIFGGAGDLSRRKLLPALARLFERGDLDRVHVVGLSREPIGDDAFRRIAADALVQAGRPPNVVERFCHRLHAHSLGRNGDDGYHSLAARLTAIEEIHGLPQNRVYYLAVPPDAVTQTSACLSAAGLTSSRGFTRVIVEKPFGRDLASAETLNDELHRYFQETQIYRIDHYLGKETVQNLLVFRFANSIFESLWNRERVRAVEITVAEELGVGSRAGYYDKSGALRDMVQNHITQLLTLVAMEVPSAFEAQAIRYEKIKVLRSIAPIDCEDVVRGRYVAGKVNGIDVPGYLDEEGVPAGSETETLVAMRLAVDTWRWQGVPFYLRSGKRMKSRSTQIVVHFRDVPVSLFRNVVSGLDTPDVLVITVQPDEGFSLHFDVKIPGQPFRLQRVPLSFKYNQAFAEMPEAYETLLSDVWHGDQTLFVHADEVLESWRIYTPLLEHPPPVVPYVAGTSGPPEADRLTASGKGLWTPE